MKLAVVMRGIPGSGKSTVARMLHEMFGAVIHSTDSYHIKDGVYTYDATKAPEYHHYNLEAFMDSCAAGKSMVIVDNTNIWPHNYEPYVYAAHNSGYKVLQIKLKNAHRVSIHSVPDEVVNRMKDAFRKYWKMRKPDYTLIIPSNASLAEVAYMVRHKISSIRGGYK